MITVQNISEFLQVFAPLQLAAAWDNVGLLLGNPNAAVQKLMTCLTVTPESATEAVKAGAQMIVTHHPIFFRPVQKLTAANRTEKFLWDLAKAGIAVYSPHTAFDNTKGGINDILAERLGLTDVGPLRARTESGKCKIVVFVPESDLQPVSDALFKVGAGRIGDYSECSYRVTGTGTFFGSDETNPALGQKGRREEVDEFRLEVICPKKKVATAVAAMRQAHSYEEPAFDVYALEPVQSSLGEGRLGRLPQSVTLEGFAKKVMKNLPAENLQLVGKTNKKVKTISVACGAAAEFLRDAVKANADVFLTGEMRFHDYLAAQAQGISLVLPGHYATERPAIEELAVILQNEFRDIKVWASRREKDPVQFLSSR